MGFHDKCCPGGGVLRCSSRARMSPSSGAVNEQMRLISLSFSTFNFLDLSS
jgi:hypothetical protein